MRTMRGRPTGTNTVDPTAGPVTLLWGYAQATGSFTIDESLIRSDAFSALNTRNMYQAAGIDGMIGGFGGGTLGITPAMLSGHSSDTPIGRQYTLEHLKCANQTGRWQIRFTTLHYPTIHHFL
jgi:hypothetical protein